MYKESLDTYFCVVCKQEHHTKNKFYSDHLQHNVYSKITIKEQNIFEIGDCIKNPNDDFPWRIKNEYEEKNCNSNFYILASEFEIKVVNYIDENPKITTYHEAEQRVKLIENLNYLLNESNI